MSVTCVVWGQVSASCDTCVFLDEADELEDVITATTESIQYDHPNHTVTVTTISDLDLSVDRLLEPQQVSGTNLFHMGE